MSVELYSDSFDSDVGNGPRLHLADMDCAKGSRDQAVEVTIPIPTAEELYYSVRLHVRGHWPLFEASKKSRRPWAANQMLRICDLVILNCPCSRVRGCSRALSKPLPIGIAPLPWMATPIGPEVHHTVACGSHVCSNHLAASQLRTGIGSLVIRS